MRAELMQPYLKRHPTFPINSPILINALLEEMEIEEKIRPIFI
jgi:hypothetical protein